MDHRYVYGALALWLVGTTGPSIAYADQLEDDHTLTTTFQTPHTDWAQPYARGSIRVLYFAEMPFSGVEYAKPRQIVELMQRFDVEVVAAYYVQVVDSTQRQWLGGEAGKERVLRLLFRGSARN